MNARSVLHVERKCHFF